jgi:hypothetical protein
VASLGIHHLLNQKGKHGAVPEPEARIDTVGVAFPIAALPDADVMVRAGWEVKSLSAVKGEGGEVRPGSGLFGVGGYQARYSRRLDGGGFVAVGKGQMAWVEASLPKRQGRWESLTLPEAMTEISAMVEDACQFVRPTDHGAAIPASDGRREHVVRVDDPKVVRLDLVREFRLANPELLSPILDGLGNVHHPGRMTTRRYADGNNGQAQTLSIGPRAWKMTLYDKHTESKTWASDANLRMLPAPAGSLRAEARLHGDQLSSRRAAAAGGTVARVVDLEEHKLRSLRRAWWDLTGCGATVTSAGHLFELVWAQPWSEAVRARFLGWVQHPSMTFTNRHLEADCRRRAELLGVVRGDLPAVDVALDYDTGRERVVALRAA